MQYCTANTAITNRKNRLIKIIFSNNFTYFQLIRGFHPYDPDLLFVLKTKSKQKIQGYARFAQKTDVRQAKLSKLAPSFRQELQTMDNFTLVSLVFWLTGQGRS
jgi:hypothetical protein